MCTKSEGTIFLIALILNCICFLVGSGSLVLSTLEHPVIYTKWSESPYKNLGPTQISASAVVVVTSLFGFLVIIMKNTKIILYVIFSILLIVSFLLSYGIGIFAAIGAVMRGRVDKFIGCDTEYTGLLNIWKSIDEYFMLGHSLLCSDLCPCQLKYETENSYKNNRFIQNELKTLNYTLSISNNYAVNLDFCPEDSRNYIMNLYKFNPNNTNRDIKFDEKDFKKYWKKIEEDFECTGWCKTSYTNIFNLNEQKMVKYLFSDMDRGIPKYPGCMNRVLKWLHTFTSLIASFLLFAAFCQTIELFTVLKLTEYKKEKSRQGELRDNNKLGFVPKKIKTENN